MSSTTVTRVILVDDHELMRDGIREALERSGEFVVVGEAADGDAAVKEAASLKPDMIIMDVIMPLKDGIEACREITDILPETRVLIFTASSEEEAVVESFAAGAAGYLEKYSGKDHLLRTARDVAQGEYRIPNDVVRRALSGIRSTTEQIDTRKTATLTDREREILTLFSQGHTYAEIADVRGNKWVTIRNAIYGIQNKLALATKRELVVWAVRNGLLDDWELGS